MLFPMESGSMDRFKSANRASILGIVGNIFLFIIKVIVGFISNSQAMIADAFNSASDILSSFMTYIGNRVASKEADEDHNLGHGKAEYIYSMLISIIMFILGFRILIDSVKSIIETIGSILDATIDKIREVLIKDAECVPGT